MKVYNKQSDKVLCEELQERLKEYRLKRNFDADKYITNKCRYLNEYMKKCSLSGCVVAVSGGIDSAVVLAIVTKASQEKNSPIMKIIPMLLPVLDSVGVTNQACATNRGRELCQSLNLKPLVIDLSKINKIIREEVENAIGIEGQAWAIGQLAPYSRTPILYYATSLLNQEDYPSIICGTTNFDEGGYLGYVGKASDGMVDLQIISDLHKSEVYKVATKLKLPKSIIDVIPSGDMYDSRIDEEVFGASYDFVELYLYFLNMSKVEQKSFKENLSPKALKQFDFFAENLENLHRYNRHKYISKSPAIHLDLWNSEVRGGWENHYKTTKEFMEEK